MVCGIAMAAQHGPGLQIMNEDFFAFCLGPPEGRAVSVRIECAPYARNSSAAKAVSAGPIHRIEGDATIRLKPRTSPTNPISAPMAKTVRQDARSITHRLAAMTSPCGAGPPA